jgi:hypothetical protein
MLAWILGTCTSVSMMGAGNISVSQASDGHVLRLATVAPNLFHVLKPLWLHLRNGAWYGILTPAVSCNNLAVL